MKTVSLVIGMVVLATGGARAADEPATIEKKDATPTIAPSLIDEKNKSTFAMPESERNPFWPIGWKPVVSKTGPEVAGPAISPSFFLVSSIALSQGEHFAIINGKVMKEGEQFGLQMGGQTYQITVKSIEDGRVILQRHNEEIVVTLRRR
jgi:hypothetical protein